MIFDKEYIAFEILDVLELSQGASKTYNAKRNFDALSFRYEADTIMEGGGVRLSLSDNSVCYVPSNLNYTRISKKDKLIIIHFKAFNYHSEKMELFIPENSEKAEKYGRLFTEMLKLWNKKGIAYKNECAALLCGIFAEFCKDNAVISEKSKIGESIEYINKNYKRSDFSLTKAAEKSFVSETYFRKLFKSEFNMSPKKYVIKLRCDYAKALLLTGYHSVSEIAEKCGYNDCKHFSVEFKKNVGVSPSKFKYNYIG